MDRTRFSFPLSFIKNVRRVYCTTDIPLFNSIQNSTTHIKSTNWVISKFKHWKICIHHYITAFCLVSRSSPVITQCSGSEIQLFCNLSPESNSRLLLFLPSMSTTSSRHHPPSRARSIPDDTSSAHGCRAAEGHMYCGLSQRRTCCVFSCLLTAGRTCESKRNSPVQSLPERIHHRS